jgi:hypothetical protein
MGQCKNCHNEFLVKRKWQNFCDEVCRNEYHNQRRRDERTKTHVKPVASVRDNAACIAQPEDRAVARNGTDNPLSGQEAALS